MEPHTTTIRASVDVALEPERVFEIAVDELQLALADRGLQAELRPGGSARERGLEVGRVTSWEPGRELVLAWRPADWEPEASVEVAVRAEPGEAGASLALELRGWGALLESPGQVVGWFAGELAAPLLRAVSPSALGDWLTDRRARRPSGEEARALYRDPVFHRPNFAVLLELLALRPEDVLLEVGCGGGALLHDALASGCRAVGVDHSPDMLRLARETNAKAVAHGRLEIVEASADRLPFPDEMFTCATMTGVLGFLPDPVAALSEIRRVLVDGGRIALLGSDPSLRGTPAAPEPTASRLRFYEDEELVRMAHEAAFSDVSVVRRNLLEPAREAGVAAEYLELFDADTPFLVARRPA